MRGLAFPTSDTYLTYFGCADLFHRDSAPPRVRIGQVEATPTGLRSFGLLMPGAGTASGPVTLVDSVAATTVAGFSARADLGSTGAAYVWYVSPGIERGQVWAGRADLAVGPQWQYVDAAAATYTWTLYDADNGNVVKAGGNATIGRLHGRERRRTRLPARRAGVRRGRVRRSTPSGSAARAR